MPSSTSLDKICTTAAEEEMGARFAFASPVPEESIASRIQHGPCVLGIPRQGTASWRDMSYAEVLRTRSKAKGQLILLLMRVNLQLIAAIRNELSGVPAVKDTEKRY